MELPPVTHDLIAIGDGSLKRWNGETGQVEVLLASQASGIAGYYEHDLPGSIVRFQVSDDGRTILAARLKAADPRVYDLLVVALPTGESRVVATDLDHLLDFELAPDGGRLAYILGRHALDVDGNSSWSLTGTVYVQDLNDGGSPRQLATCDNVDGAEQERRVGCRALSWFPDGHQLMWTDAEGLWSHDLGSQASRLLVMNRYDLDGGYNYAVYTAQDWSPSGRYLQLWMAYWEGGRNMIWDRQAERLLEVPHSDFCLGTPIQTSVAWTHDDRLFMVRPMDRCAQSPYVAEIWRLPSNTELLTLESSHPAPDESNLLAAPAQLANGLLAFAVVPYGDGPGETPGLYLLDPGNGALQKTNDMPPGLRLGAHVEWIPTGDGALIWWYDYDANEDVFVYVIPGDPLFYDVRPFLGQTVRDPLKWIDLCRSCLR